MCGLVTEDFRGKFDALPQLSLYAYWAAEGFLSLGSLTDRADNDYFGGTDPLANGEETVRMYYAWALKQVRESAGAMAESEGPDVAQVAAAETLGLIRYEVHRVGLDYAHNVRHEPDPELRGRYAGMLRELRTSHADVTALLSNVRAEGLSPLLGEPDRRTAVRRPVARATRTPAARTTRSAAEA
jgi:hypothetical protein